MAKGRPFAVVKGPWRPQVSLRRTRRASGFIYPPFIEDDGTLDPIAIHRKPLSSFDIFPVLVLSTLVATQAVEFRQPLVTQAKTKPALSNEYDGVNLLENTLSNTAKAPFSNSTSTTSSPRNISNEETYPNLLLTTLVPPSTVEVRAPIYFNAQKQRFTLDQQVPNLLTNTLQAPVASVPFTNEVDVNVQPRQTIYSYNQGTNTLLLSAKPLQQVEFQGIQRKQNVNEFDFPSLLESTLIPPVVSVKPFTPPFTETQQRKAIGQIVYAERGIDPGAPIIGSAPFSPVDFISVGRRNNINEDVIYNLPTSTLDYPPIASAGSEFLPVQQKFNIPLDVYQSFVLRQSVVAQPLPFRPPVFDGVFRKSVEQIYIPPWEINIPPAPVVSPPFLPVQMDVVQRHQYVADVPYDSLVTTTLEFQSIASAMCEWPPTPVRPTQSFSEVTNNVLILKFKTYILAAGGTITYSGVAVRANEKIVLPSGFITFSGTGSMQFLPNGIATTTSRIPLTGAGRT
jgi:hypothetical protein